MNPKRLSALIGWVLPALILVLWEGLSGVGCITPNVLPAPSQVFAAFLTLLANGRLLHNIAISAWRALTGFAIGGSIGFVFGFANGLSNLSRNLTDTTLQMVRNILHTASQHLPNDTIHQIISADSVFVGIGSVDPVVQGTKAALDEAERATKTFGLKGIDVEPGFGAPPRHPKGRAYFPV